MKPSKKSKNSDFKFISEERKKEVEQVFKSLGLINQRTWPNHSNSSEGYGEPFQQFSILKNKETVFTSSS